MIQHHQPVRLSPSQVPDSHVLGDRCVADGVGGGRDGRLAAVAAAAAVQAGHVHAVQVVVVLPPSVAQRLVLAVFVAPADVNNDAVTEHRHQREPLLHQSRGPPMHQVGVLFCVCSSLPGEASLVYAVQ